MLNEMVREEVSQEAGRDRSEIKTKAYLFLKRTGDILGSGIGLVVLSPFFLVIMLLIYMDDPHGSPIFKQIRVGKDGKEFYFYKFRSMVSNAEELRDELEKYNEMCGHCFKMKDDPRITRIGKFIRKTSIDELPQLYNVLRGDMSLVGPRPPIPREVKDYNAYEMKRLSVKPGLTCLWQVTPKRNDLDFYEWVELDLQYIRNRSLSLDISLIFKTLYVMLTAQGR